MEFEQCEIRVNRYDRGWLGPHWEFIAMARGPEGTYTVASTPRFPGYVPHWYYYIPLIKPDISYVELLENELSRGVLDSLIDHLTHAGWALLVEAGGGKPWYTCTFQRRVSADVPDPASSPEVRWGPEDLNTVFLAFLNTGTVDESVRILERSKDVLLTQTAFQALQTMINISETYNREDVNNLEQKRRLLELARDMKDVQKAGQAMQCHLDEVRDAVVAFMIAKTDALRQTWEQHQKILLTTEGIRRAKRLAEQLKEGERSGDSGDPRRHRVREFRVRYLEDARAHGIDYAQRHYYEGLGEIF